MFCHTVCIVLKHCLICFYDDKCIFFHKCLTSVYYKFWPQMDNGSFQLEHVFILNVSIQFVVMNCFSLFHTGHYSQSQAGCNISEGR